jgi:hypothetical protein
MVGGSGACRPYLLWCLDESWPIGYEDLGGRSCSLFNLGGRAEGRGVLEPLAIVLHRTRCY